MVRLSILACQACVMSSLCNSHSLYVRLVCQASYNLPPYGHRANHAHVPVIIFFCQVRRASVSGIYRNLSKKSPNRSETRTSGFLRRMKLLPSLFPPHSRVSSPDRLVENFGSVAARCFRGGGASVARCDTALSLSDLLNSFNAILFRIT